MHYLIDGYNLLFNECDTKLNLQNKREKILSTLQAVFNTLKVEVSVIFDGKNQDLNIHHIHSLNVIYTPEGYSADDYILEKITFTKQPALFTVVTSDKLLSKKCKDLRAKVISVKSFLNWIKKKQNKQSIKSIQEFKDTKSNIDRLLKIFEDKLNED